MTKSHLKRPKQFSATLIRWSLLPCVFLTDSYALASLSLVVLAIYQAEAWYRSGKK
jgi:hypothetical protein